MVKRKHYGPEMREKLLLELVSGQKSVAQIAQREGIHPQTLRNWKKEAAAGNFEANHGQELALRRRIAELEGALADTALQNHILKKAQKYMKEYARKERLSRPISRRISGS
ncbi:MAG: transposase [Spirochaetales bacterium]|nr:transposase [Spirochaetales bacterium]